MSSFLQGLQSRAKDIRETLTPALSTSAFTSRGVLTPAQFVLAGDELVASCPTWQWSGATGKGTTRGYLPPGKQFLVTRGVPSTSRCRGADFLPQAAMMKDNGEGWMVEDDGVGGEDEGFDLCEGGEDPKKAPPAASTGGGGDPPQPEVTEGPPSSAVQEGEDEDDEYADMDDFTDPDLADDLSSLAVSPSAPPANLRRYDVMISYDKYYQTPRVWLLGYSPSGSPLPGPSMFEDVMEDYVNRTVTVERFPYTGEVVISVHPCQHGNVMKNIVENMREGGGEVRVESYMTVFLKFVSSIIPRINYDFTQGVEAGK
ncbi:hypothetical protein TrRE_jg6071 [Triparma retinervis]|uniref:Autophagy-related protein 3 n=1 Tax=Triparma retinervis TaxID=2557542 RepID=A0A9W7AGV3_9STRA|nr:hypothetical protein TrRE_jg6071 [Triparma retinervis]